MPLPTGWCKLNIYTAWDLGTWRAQAGGNVQDEKGNTFLTMHACIGRAASAHAAEIGALPHALDYCRMLRCLKLLVEMDATGAAKDIVLVERPVEHDSLLRKIHYILAIS